MQRMDLFGYIEQFTAWLADEKGYSPHTVVNYRRDLLEFSASAGGQKDVTSIDTRVIRNYVYGLNIKNSSSSVARKLSALRTFFRFLVQEHVIEQSPMGSISMPKQEQYIPIFLSVDEVFALLEAPGLDDTFAERDRAILELLYSTGIRVSELVGCNMVNLDFDNEMLRIKGKGNKERLVPIGNPAIKALEIYLPERQEMFKNLLLDINYTYSMSRGLTPGQIGPELAIETPREWFDFDYGRVGFGLGYTRGEHQCFATLSNLHGWVRDTV